MSDLVLVIYYPDENSDAAEKLRLLATLGAGASKTTEPRMYTRPSL